ncbi:2-polyprenyl-6-methoxyphenol hydroxylase [Faunimonas pinastri]|uniref:2-polyprenyl-6-methoxyphenol hydroxylase n=1 Tax=Faunimonas pinastri TaxID=1855383 RepID=A0A1H9GPW1_9HYPH|nr:FAD-dependent monooxygenase [Faunimonas pinastri]SEQ52080.1 2-polyprenyl-6-methoxyphenol hydroxylase [Faunimonas pinastri]
MRIVCIGGGPAGLFVSILLKRQNARNQVTVHERNAPHTTFGWGVTFGQDFLRDLDAADATVAAEILRQSLSWSSMAMFINGAAPLFRANSGLAIGRQTLLDLLTKRANDVGVEIFHQSEIRTPADVPGADIVVAADGAGSVLRQGHAREFGANIGIGRNKYVWLGTSRLFEAFTIGFTRTDAGWIWFYAYGFAPGTSTFIVECAPETWAGLGFDRMGAAESLRKLEGLFARELGGHALLSAEEGSPGRLAWRRFRLVRNRRWSHGNLVLVGDAAHTTHFSIGSGTRLAMQDAAALAGHLAREFTVKAALSAYERERRRAMAAPARDARLSAEWLENVPRYAGSDPERFFSLFLDRRSRIMPWISPEAYGRLDRASRQMPILQTARDLIAGRRPGRSPDRV